MTTANEVAKTLIHLAAIDPEEDPMTALKLHKLLYYCQGWHLAWYGQPLFQDRIEAWKHGPVVPAIWSASRGHGKEPMLDPGPANVPASDRASIEQVWSHYRKFSASGLRDKTHEEPPWKAHYIPDQNFRCSEIIPTSDLALFFGEEFHRQTGERPGAARFESGVSLEQLRQELCS